MTFLQFPIRAAALLTSACTLAGCCCAGYSSTDPVNDIEAAGGQMLPIATATTADQSVQKAPLWATEAQRSAPQGLDISRLMTSLHKLTPLATIDRDLLLCRATVSGQYDNAHAPDIDLKLKLGNNPPVHIQGPEDNAVVHFSVPVVSLTQGDEMSFEGFDRDPGGQLQPVGAIKEIFQADLWTLKDKDLEVHCRAMPRELVETQLNRAHLQMVKDRQALVEPLKVDLDAQDWGEGDNGMAQLRRSVVATAALVGWADERTQRFVQEFDSTQSQWNQTVSKALAEKLKKSDAALVHSGLKIAARSTCDTNAEPLKAGSQKLQGGCAVVVDVTNTGMRPLSVAPGQIGPLRALDFVTPQGRRLDATALETPAKSTLDPDATATMVLWAGPKAKLGQEAAALRLDAHPTGMLWWPVEAP